MKTNFRMTLDDMILISLDSVLKRKHKCSFGDLVHECFRKYPQHFSLGEYPKYPDSLKLDRPLRNLRLKRMVKGSPVTHYSLTITGKEFLNRLTNSVKGQKDNEKTLISRSPSLRKIKNIKNSKNYKLFLDKNNKYYPNEMEFRSLLETTLETPHRNIIQEIDLLLIQAKKQKDNDVVRYLKKQRKIYK